MGIIVPIPAHPACESHSILNSGCRNVGSTGCGHNCDQSSRNNMHSDWRGHRWYRFSGAAGTQMPESAPEAYKCGTHATGWLAGGHPTVWDGEVTRTINFHWTDNLSRSTTAQVVNCGVFFVYKLKEVPG